MGVTRNNNECSTISHAENYTYMDKILLIHTETLIEVVSMGKLGPKVLLRYLRCDKTKMFDLIAFVKEFGMNVIPQGLPKKLLVKLPS